MPITLTLADLNQLSDADFEQTLRQCSTSKKWLAHMVAGRPFDSLGKLLHAAKIAWLQLETSDYLDVISSHPRIGAKKSEQSEFSKREQASLALTDELAVNLARYNDAYFEKFGFIFLIFASGKSATEILAQLKIRITHSSQEEIKIAAHELMQIQDLRLKQMVSSQELTLQLDNIFKIDF